jgi:hypothetical protein
MEMVSSKLEIRQLSAKRGAPVQSMKTKMTASSFWVEQRFSAAIKGRKRPALTAGVMDIGKQIRRHLSG